MMPSFIFSVSFFPLFWTSQGYYMKIDDPDIIRNMEPEAYPPTTTPISTRNKKKEHVHVRAHAQKHIN